MLSLLAILLGLGLQRTPCHLDLGQIVFLLDVSENVVSRLGVYRSVIFNAMDLLTEAFPTELEFGLASFHDKTTMPYERLAQLGPSEGVMNRVLEGLKGLSSTSNGTCALDAMVDALKDRQLGWHPEDGKRMVIILTENDFAEGPGYLTKYEAASYLSSSSMSRGDELQIILYQATCVGALWRSAVNLMPKSNYNNDPSETADKRALADRIHRHICGSPLPPRGVNPSVSPVAPIASAAALALGSMLAGAYAFVAPFNGSTPTHIASPTHVPSPTPVVSPTTVIAAPAVNAPGPNPYGEVSQPITEHSKFDLTLDSALQQLDLDPTSWTSWANLGVESLKDKLIEKLVESCFEKPQKLDLLFRQIKDAESTDEVREMLLEYGILSTEPHV
ncbi:MAG: uncharacterized protein KVP18_004254 [Porospora cf. gigantea A]|nr:MAG: hypothetical protein KVP18_004254 [Porospora cf. gigantea A]